MAQASIPATATALPFAPWSCCAQPPGVIVHPDQLPAAGSAWLPAVVPGTIAAALQASGRWHARDPRDLDAEDWWFRTTFDAPDGHAGQLCFDGLATLAEVWLNGRRLLAAMAAAGESVDNLVLWASVIKGRSYVRELKALSLTGTGHATPPAEGIEAAGFFLSEPTVHELSRLDLLQCRPPCRRVLIVTRDDLPADDSLLAHFASQGVEAQQTVQPGYADMMTEPHDNKIPQQAIASIVAWLPAASQPMMDTNHAVPRCHSALDLTVVERGIHERVLTIGQQPCLVGIVSECQEPVTDQLPWIVLLNAGSVHRVGPHRLYVTLARQLAAVGFRCLRLDLCGLGDSITPDCEHENDPYPAATFRDIDATLTHLHNHLGVQRVVLMGLCSGAYAAFQSAAQLSHPVLVESVLINPLAFYWRAGMSLEPSAAARQLQTFREGLHSAWRPSKWWKLLSGQSKMGLAGALGTVIQRWRLRQRSSQRASTDHRDRALDVLPSHPAREDVPGDLERAVRAGRHVACFFARSDPGYDLLMLHASRQVKELRRTGRMSVYFLDDSDHTFSRRAWRQALVQAIIEHLQERYPATMRFK
jgi:hypothetical protein